MVQVALLVALLVVWLVASLAVWEVLHSLAWVLVVCHYLALVVHNYCSAVLVVEQAWQADKLTADAHLDNPVADWQQCSIPDR